MTVTTRRAWDGGFTFDFTTLGGGFDPETVLPPTPLPESVIAARAIDSVTVAGTDYKPQTRPASRPYTPYRIVVGGKDVTYFRGAQTPFPEYGLESPLGYGSGRLVLPQVHAAFERAGHGELSFLQPWAKVRVQRVDAEDGHVIATDYIGLVSSYDHSGREFSMVLGGEAIGQASIMDRPMVIFPQVNDIGGQVQRTIQRVLRLPIANMPTTGVEIAETGGGRQIDWLTDVLAKSTMRDGRQWTVMPTSGGYRMFRKDTETIDATVYPDGFKVQANLKRDFSEEPNRVWAQGIDEDGRRIRFTQLPGLALNPRTSFPGSLSPGDSGDDVLTVAWRLYTISRLGAPPFDLDWTTDDEDPLTLAIQSVQKDAGLSRTGVVNNATWNAIFDPEVTGFSVKRAVIKPAAAQPWTQAYLFNGTGQIIGDNPAYDRTRVRVDVSYDMGAGFNERQIERFAERDLVDGETPNWVGTITIYTGAVIDGEHNVGDPFDASDLRDVRSLKPGMNLWLPTWDDGTLVHISGVSVSKGSQNAPNVVELAVDTRARDTQQVWEVIRRNRESRRRPARHRFAENRRSAMIDDTGAFYDPGFGRIERTFCPANEPTVIVSPAGRSGTLSEIDIQTTDDEAVFGLSVWGHHITKAQATRRLTDPFADGYFDHIDARQDDWFDNYGLVDVFGQAEQPCGYGSRMHTKKDGTLSDAPITGRFRFKAGAPFRCYGQPVLYIVVWPDRDCWVQGGRVLDLLQDDGVS